MARPEVPYRIHVVGAARTPLRDAYHAFLRIPWWSALGAIVLAYCALNAVFALGFLATGGVTGTEPGSFADAYVFSVQTMGTIGYGAMYPASGAAHALVVTESVCGLLFTALATGLVFSKFARSRARVAFAASAVISPVDGVPHLMVRFGNLRGNRLVEANLRMDYVRTVVTAEGHTLYRMSELALVRQRTPELTRSYLIQHAIDAASPLAQKTPAAFASEDSEIIVSVIGLDDTTTQTVHAAHHYVADEVLWGARYRDVLSERPDGDLVLDLRLFHATEPTQPSAGFPYPVSALDAPAD